MSAAISLSVPIINRFLSNSDTNNPGMVQDKLDIPRSEDEKQASICHRGDVHAGECPSILLTWLPSREELGSALPSGNVLLAEGKRHG